jgi:hypothetical protein
MAEAPPAPPRPRRRWGRILAGVVAALLLESLLPAAFQPSAWLLRGGIRAYQAALSPLLQSAGSRCRYQPSCSEFAAQAVARYGSLRGSAFALSRIGRCAPGGGSGLDPVP